MLFGFQSLERLESDVTELNDRASDLERQNRKLESVLEEKREAEEEVSKRVVRQKSAKIFILKSIELSKILSTVPCLVAPYSRYSGKNVFAQK